MTTLRILTLALVSALSGLPMMTLMTPVSAQTLTSYEQAVSEYEPTVLGELWSRTELYFGAEKPDGSEVSDAAFQVFVNEEVTPRFPEGLTLLEGFGQGRDEAGLLVREESRVLILLYPEGSEEANREIEEIRQAYKAAFEQESVLRVDSLERVSF